jgi:hypothetical protein
MYAGCANSELVCVATHLLDEAFFVHLGVCEAKLRDVASDSTLVLKKTLLWTLGYQRRGSVIAKR